jgi:anti-sigma factor RsiW
MNESRDDQACPWEDQINAYLDRELSAAESAALEKSALENPELGRELETARQLHSLLSAMPAARAPRRLRRKLTGIAGPAWGLSAAQWAWLRGGLAVACLPLVLVVANLGDSGQPSEADILQGRQELALALAYISRASQKTNDRISNRLSSSMIEPITENTLETLSQQMVLPKEYAL